MLAEKRLTSNSNPSKFHLPPVNKRHRRKLRPPPTPSHPSSAARAAHLAENISALKAKYADYATWLKTTNRQSREPVFTNELLKASLCRMGIDSTQADKVVSKCSWYVYQFQKTLKIDPAHENDILEEKQILDQYKNISKKPVVIKDIAEDSTTTFSSFDKDDTGSSTSFPRLRNNQLVLPAINPSGLSNSSRLRRVDFDNEQEKNARAQTPTSAWQLALLKTRNLEKLPPIPTETSESDNTDASVNNNISFRNLRRHGLVVGHLRSILRKQPTSTCPSITSTEVSHRKTRSRVLTPSSTVIDDIPLGTRSQRLFGGSEYFAQIMNELEQQKKNK